MSFTTADLASATAKLDTLTFTEAEAQAVAAFLAADHDDVSGFGYEKDNGNGFLLEVSGFMPGSKGFILNDHTSFTATDDLARFTATDDLARVHGK